MLTLRVLHQHIIGLIQHVRAIAVRAIVCQIQILIHVSIHRSNSVLRILCIKCINQFLKISLGNRRIILQNTNRYILFQRSVKDSTGYRILRSLCLFLGICCCTTSCQACEHHGCKQHATYQSLFHRYSSLVITYPTASVPFRYPWDNSTSF